MRRHAPQLVHDQVRRQCEMCQRYDSVYWCFNDAPNEHRHFCETCAEPQLALEALAR